VTEEERPNGPAAAIISDALWHRRFGGDPAVVGRTVTLNNAPVTIVGVLPEDFDFASVFSPGARVDLFIPAPLDTMKDWGNTLALVGRLKPPSRRKQPRRSSTRWGRGSRSCNRRWMAGRTRRSRRSRRT